MLTKLSLPSLTNWKLSFSSSMPINDSMMVQKKFPIQSMISANQNHEFQRFFTKKYEYNITVQNPNNSTNIEELEKQASNNNAESAYKLTKIYKNKTELREKYLKLAAILGHKAAMYEYAFDTINGNIKTQNDKKLADECIKLIISEGKPDVLYQASLYYYNINNIEKCEECLKISIEKGSIKALTFYGFLLIKRNPEESIRFFKKAIEYKDPIAMFYYSLNIYNGNFKTFEGKPIDRKDAFKYMKMSADDKNYIQQAARNCGLMLYHGDLCDKNIKESMVYFKKAFQLGDVESEYYYGNAVFNGYADVKPNKKLGAQILKKAAYKGHPIAAYLTAMNFRNGDGLLVVPHRSNQFFKFSASKNYVPAIRVCAYSYFTGRFKDFEKDLTFAAKYVQDGAKLKDPTCIFNLGLIYMSGEGIKKNYEKGQFYLKLAQKNGFENALEIGEKIYKNNISAIDYFKA